MSSDRNNTLGYHLDMSKTIFGADSRAVKYLDKKIAESPRGRDEPVMAAESQMVYLLMSIHMNGETCAACNGTARVPLNQLDFTTCESCEGTGRA